MQGEAGRGCGMHIGLGRGGDTRRVLVSVFSVFCWFPQQVMWQVWVSASGELTPLVSGCMTQVFGCRKTACTSVKMATLRAIMVRQERDLVSFGSRSGPYAGVVKRVVGVGGGARSACTLFFIVVTLRNRKKSSETLAITTKVCQSEPTFCGIVV